MLGAEKVAGSDTGCCQVLLGSWPGLGSRLGVDPARDLNVLTYLLGYQSSLIAQLVKNPPALHQGVTNCRLSLDHPPTTSRTLLAVTLLKFTAQSQLLVVGWDLPWAG